MDDDVIVHFKNLSEDSGASHQDLINLYLRDCMAHGKGPICHGIDFPVVPVETGSRNPATAFGSGIRERG